MKRFSEANFNHIFIPLVPFLSRAGLLTLKNKSHNTPYSDADERYKDNINKNTVCRLTKKTIKNLQKIRKGNRIRFVSADQKVIFNAISKIINDHLDEESEQDAFNRHMKKGMYMPSIELGN